MKRPFDWNTALLEAVFLYLATAIKGWEGFCHASVLISVFWISRAGWNLREDLKARKVAEVENVNRPKVTKLERKEL